MQLNSVRLYEQIAGLIREGIVGGKLAQGERLPTERNIANLVEIRQIIEPSVAGLAAERATADDLARLRVEVEVMERSYKNVDAFIAADHRFHVAIANCTQNKLVGLMLFPIVDVLNEQ